MKYNEHNLQKSCVTWFRYQYPDKIIFAIPNARKVSSIAGDRLKAEGVLAGVPDLFIASPNTQGYNGFFIEMKTEKGKLTKAQEDIAMKLTFHGYRVAKCTSLESFMNLVNNYFKPE